jgi:hypothetical protein
MLRLFRHHTRNPDRSLRISNPLKCAIWVKRIDHSNRHQHLPSVPPGDIGQTVDATPFSGSTWPRSAGSVRSEVYYGAMDHDGTRLLMDRIQNHVRGSRAPSGDGSDRVQQDDAVTGYELLDRDIFLDLAESGQRLRSVDCLSSTTNCSAVGVWVIYQRFSALMPICHVSTRTYTDPGHLKNDRGGRGNLYQQLHKTCCRQIPVGRCFSDKAEYQLY